MKQMSILAFFWRHIKPYKWYYAVMLIPTVLTSFYSFAYHYSIKLLVDGLTNVGTSYDYSLIITPIALYLGATLMLETIWRTSHIAAWKSLPYVRRSFLLEAYDYVQHHSYYYFQNNFTGAITSKLKGIVNGYDRFWGEFHHGIFVSGCKILVDISVLMFFNKQLGSFLCAWSVFFLVFMYKLSTKLDRLAFVESESKYAIFSQVSDKFMNIISIFSFSSHKRELDLLDKHIKHDLIPKQVAFYKYDFKVQVIAAVCYVTKMFCTLLYSIYLRKQGLISIGDFTFVLGLTLALSDTIWHTVSALPDLLREVGDLKSSFSILHEKQDNLDATAQPLHIVSPQIEFRNVYFHYPTLEVVLKNLNLIIHAGEKIGIVGHSGAGKTSLFNLLMRYFNCQEGQILIDGQDISLVHTESLRNHIAIIPQDPILFHRSLLDNLRYGNPEATETEVIAACKKAHIHEIIMNMPEQYKTYTGERGIKLSGGQRQRIAIARAILKKAPILLLDEATSALDSQTENLIQKSLNALMDNNLQTVIAIAHRLSTLKYMDRIIVLDQGSIVEQGTHEQLINDSTSLYSKLWKIQIQES